MIKTLLTIGLGLSCYASAQQVRTMFAYTQDVSNESGGYRNANSLVNTKFAQAERVFEQNNRNSGINLIRGARFKTSYRDRKVPSTQLDRLRSGRQLRDVRNKRDETNADLVQLFCHFSNSGTAGIAYIPGAFSVVAAHHLATSSGNNAWSPAHEFGHNFNGVHSHGFCMTSREKTIMRTNGSCSSKRRIPYFSHSSFRKNNIRLGNSSHNNRGRVIRRASANSRYR